MEIDSNDYEDKRGHEPNKVMEKEYNSCVAAPLQAR